MRSSYPRRGLGGFVVWVSTWLVASSCSSTAAEAIPDGGDTETPLECSATPCADGEACSGPADCASGICETGICRAAPDAPDGAAPDGAAPDAGETSDCGGATKPPCDDGKACAAGGDCKSGACTNGVCAAPTSSDGVKNGNETDVDCGSGPTGIDTQADPCAVGKACLAKSDCFEADCVEGVCTWTSSDGFKNGTESDVDCGGGAPTNAPPCAVGSKCAGPADCASDACMRDGPKAGTCTANRSCATHYGGQTCGAGEVAGGGAAHESCCTSLPVAATFQDRLHPGKRVYLDKYEITAGRMREFITRMEELYGGQANIRAWIQANMPPFWNDSADAAVNWTRWLPTGKSTVVSLPRFNTYKPSDSTPDVANPQGDVGTDWILGPNGWYFYTHGHNCDAEYGYPTYWYPPADWLANHSDADPATPLRPRMTREQLDVRSLNCVPNALLAAFCAWDGGQLATVSVLQEVTKVPYGNRNLASCTAARGGTSSPSCSGSFFYGVPEASGRFGPLTEGGVPSWRHFNNPLPCPGNDACAFANYSDDAGWIHWGPQVPYYYSPGVDDWAARIAAPGRMTRDVVRVNAADEPWMDLRGNLQELSLDDRTANTYAFGGVHYDSIGRRGKDANRARQPEFKIGQAGGRCMRFRDP
ncbi:MAG: hypothetical protein KF782_18555 [Labilithrix sp.]|nr:hypothetical protein [Labilithrix sp.]